MANSARNFTHDLACRHHSWFYRGNAQLAENRRQLPAQGVRVVSNDTTHAGSVLERDCGNDCRGITAKGEYGSHISESSSAAGGIQTGNRQDHRQIKISLLVHCLTMFLK